METLIACVIVYLLGWFVAFVLLCALLLLWDERQWGEWPIGSRVFVALVVSLAWPAAISYFVVNRLGLE